MKAKQLLFLLSALAVLAVFSCKKDDDPAGSGKYATGVFVVCEGPFGSGTGTVTWHDPESGETVQDIYGLENGGAALGNIAQSLIFHEGKGYIVVNNANKIVVVDATTFKAEAEINGFALPRFLLPMDAQFALVSEWGADGLSGRVLKLDLTTREIVDSVQVGHGPEKLFRLNDTDVLVPNGGGYGVDSTVQILDWKTMEVKETRTLFRKNPTAFASPNFLSDKPYVLCKGEFGGIGCVAGWNSTDDFNGQIPNTFSDDLVVSPDGQSLYFSAGGKVRAARMSGLSELFAYPAYSVGVDSKTGNILVGDAKDFSSSGEVAIFNASGTKISAFTTGVTPGEIVVVR